MFDPDGWEAGKKAPGKICSLFAPKLNKAMSWNFSQGNILDYGCGGGSVTYQLCLPQAEATDSQLFATDISPKMIDFAKNNWAHPRIHYGTGCFPDNFPFGATQFDKIYSFLVFHLISDIVPTLAGMMNILKPGGQLGFVTSTIKNPLLQLYRFTAHSPTWSKYMPNVIEFSPEWTVRGDAEPEEFYRNILVHKLGFKERHFEFTTVDANFQENDLFNVLLSMNPFMTSLSPDLKDSLREDYRKYITSTLNIPLDSQEIIVPFEIICAVLEKPVVCNDD